MVVRRRRRTGRCMVGLPWGWAVLVSGGGVIGEEQGVRGAGMGCHAVEGRRKCRWKQITNTCRKGGLGNYGMCSMGLRVFLPRLWT